MIALSEAKRWIGYYFKQLNEGTLLPLETEFALCKTLDEESKEVKTK